MIAERKAGLPQSLLLLIGSCLPVLGAVLLAPVLPRMQEHFSSTPGVAILVPVALTLPALVIALLAPFAGVIADRIGRKVLLLSGMFIYTLCGVMPLWLESLEAIVISRAGIGLAEAAIMTCCTTLVGDYFDGAKREHLFALQMVSTSLSAAVFMGVGGMLGESGWRTPFALYTVGLLFLPLMAVLLWEPRQRARDESVTAAVRFPWRALLPIYGLTLLAGASLFIVPVQVGYLLNLLHVNAPQQIGITMGASQLGCLELPPAGYPFANPVAVPRLRDGCHR
jgi:MFS family permease